MTSPSRFASAAAAVIMLASLGIGSQGVLASGTHRAGAALKLIHPGFLTVGSDTTYPPMEASNLNHPGTYRGADIDLANALARAMGLRGAKIVSTNFNTIIPTLQRGNFDVIMSSMNDTPLRRKQISFVDYMSLKASESILVPKSSSIHAASYAGICGHSIAVQSGTTEFADVTAASTHCKGSKIDIHAYTADTDAFQALAGGHTDAYTTDLPVGLYYVKTHSSALRFAGHSFGGGGDYGIGLLKRAHALHHSLVAALHHIEATGKYRKILRKWGLGSTAIGGR